MKMEISRTSCILAFLSLLVSPIVAASSWSFNDASVTVQSKGSGVGAGLKEKLVASNILSKTVSFQSADSLKVVLTATENGKPGTPHQAFLLVTEPRTGHDVQIPFAVKETGKARVDVTQKDLPVQFLSAPQLLRASIVIGSFGRSKPYRSDAFDLDIRVDADASAASSHKPLRYGKMPEIQHAFRPDAQSPPRVVTLFFAVAVLVTPAALLSAWFSLGANLDQVSQAFQTSPIGHLLFVGSILVLEGIFFMYYTSWNLFQTLPAVAVVGATAYLSGSRALTEVQGRRLASQR